MWTLRCLYMCIHRCLLSWVCRYLSDIKLSFSDSWLGPVVRLNMSNTNNNNNDDNKCPDGTTILPWAREKPVAWDVTVPDTYAIMLSHTLAAQQLNQTDCDRIPTSMPSAQKTAQNKIDKYSKLASIHIFYPFAIETAGTWHEMAIELTQEIGRCISTITEDTQETTFLFQRLSMVLLSH